MSFLGHANPTPATPNDSAFTTADKDVEVADLPTDSISSIDFAPQADFLAVGSWDNSVRVYEIGEGGQSQGKAIHQHAGPVLSVCWSRDGKVFSGSVDNTAAMLDVSTGQAMQVAQHDAPVKAVKWVDTPSGAVLATGSWDKTVKYWDMRSPTPVITVNLPERCYAFDAQFPFVVAGSADRQIQVFNLANPQTPYKTLTSPLHGLTRVISCFTATSTHGFAIGSVEGRVGIQYIEDRDTQQNFAFKCHRRDSSPTSKDQAIIYPVNDISFHPTQGTFSTCGADGSIYIWDKDARSRLKTFETMPAPIVATAFNHTGRIFVYAVSYDWHKGHAGMVPGHTNKLFLHACKDEEVTKKPPTRK